MKLRNFDSVLQKEINEQFRKEQSRLLFSVKQRFYQKGIDGRGKSLGKYAPSTIKKKKKSAFTRVSHVTLRDSGGWYSNLFTKFETNTLLLDNKDKALTKKLIEGEGKHFGGYGEGILEFSQDEITSIETTLARVSNIVSKEFNENIDIEIRL